MPHYRFIIEGTGFQMPTQYEADEDDDHIITGFFTTRKSRAPDVQTARSVVLEELRNEWIKYGPRLTVLDAWKVGALDFRRVPNKGHSFFSDEETRHAAASLEAKAARAPKNAAIWQLAGLHVPADA